MRSNKVILAVEDTLSDAVSTKILEYFGLEIVQKIGFKGNSFLKENARNLNRTAKRFYNVFLLTDLDSPKNCPPKLIQSWVGAPLNSGFLFRVAVMEIESWIMADRRGIAKFLSVPLNRIPHNTDEIEKPKEFLVSLARRSRKRTLRRELAPAQGAATAKVGPLYNARFNEFVRDYWDLERAATVSVSLKRTMDRISSLYSA